MAKEENELYEVIERLTEERDYYRTKCVKLQEMLDELESMYILDDSTKADVIKINEKWEVIDDEWNRSYHETVVLC